jgi:electron transport complex protein RnfG
MVGVNLDDDKIMSLGVTTHSETPGVGSKAKTDPKLANQFKGLDLVKSFKVKPDGGEIDAMSGATVTSRGVCVGATEAGNIYKRLKPQIAEKIKEFK